MVRGPLLSPVELIRSAATGVSREINTPSIVVLELNTVPEEPTALLRLAHRAKEEPPTSWRSSMVYWMVKTPVLVVVVEG
jgi:hypothetical protein